MSSNLSYGIALAILIGFGCSGAKTQSTSGAGNSSGTNAASPGGAGANAGTTASGAAATRASMPGSPITGTGGALAPMSSAGGNSGGASGGNAGAPGAGSAGASAPGMGSANGAAGTSGSPGSTLPPASDYGAPGPFTDAKMFTSTGPNNNYTLFRPDASLGKDGFKHPIATWGNGISTTPDMYQKTLTLIATHGFVIIACNDTMAERACLSDGMDWLVAQNASGAMAGKLDTTRELAIGYSWGGGAAIDTSDRPNIIATVSLHGMPPRTDVWSKMHAPLLLFTSTGDSFVTASGYVTPNYMKSQVQTFYATLSDSTAGHLYVVDPGGLVCIASAALGECKGDAAEHAPTIAWLRLWAYGDQDARKFFYGDTCTLCSSPWTMPQRKNWP